MSKQCLPPQSLVRSCPVCGAQVYIEAKFCSGCGTSIQEAEERIKSAQIARGGDNRELTYDYKEKGPGGSWRKVSYTMDIDEYVIKKEGFISLWKIDGFPDDREGELYLTNKKIIFLGTEREFRIRGISLAYEFDKITSVSMGKEGILFMKFNTLTITYDGKVRKFNISGKELANWYETINSSPLRR